MANWLSSLTPEVWTAIFAGIGTSVIVIGTIIALMNLRVISKNQHLASVREFTKDLTETAEDQKFVLQEFNFSLKDPNPLPSEIERKVQNVVDALNRIGLLMENGLLSSKLVFSICHTMIIRLWYKLEPYVQYHEVRIGGRYGRRLARLATRAKRYHDAKPQHRITKIKIDPGPEKEPFIIYETTIKQGLAGVEQKMIWSMKRFFSIY